jgi:hypothetical protein
MFALDFHHAFNFTSRNVTTFFVTRGSNQNLLLNIKLLAKYAVVDVDDSWKIMKNAGSSISNLLYKNRMNRIISYHVKVE